MEAVARRLVAEEWLNVSESPWFDWVPPPGFVLRIGEDVAAEQVEVRSCDTTLLPNVATCRGVEQQGGVWHKGEGGEEGGGSLGSLGGQGDGAGEREAEGGGGGQDEGTGAGRRLWQPLSGGVRLRKWGCSAGQVIAVDGSGGEVPVVVVRLSWAWVLCRARVVLWGQVGEANGAYYMEELLGLLWRGSGCVINSLPRIHGQEWCSGVRVEVAVVVWRGRSAGGEGAERGGHFPRNQFGGQEWLRRVLTVGEASVTIIHDQAHVFLGGAGGYGKAFFMSMHIMPTLLEAYRRDAVGVTAMTNDAAADIGGCTLHSWMGIGLCDGSPAQLVKEMSISTVNRLRRAKVLVVGEAGILEADLAHRIDAVLRIFLTKDKVWGGLLMLLCGDFPQLGPVGDLKRLRDGSYEQGPIKYLFESWAWHYLHFQLYCMLVSQTYPPGSKYWEVLSEIRESEFVTRRLYDLLDERTEAAVNESCPEPGPGVFYSMNTRDCYGNDWGSHQSCFRKWNGQMLLVVKKGDPVVAVSPMDDIPNGSVGWVKGFVRSAVPSGCLNGRMGVNYLRCGVSNAAFVDDWKYVGSQGCEEASGVVDGAWPSVEFVVKGERVKKTVFPKLMVVEDADGEVVCSRFSGPFVTGLCVHCAPRAGDGCPDCCV
eukprot:jgi/Botrbrau1/16712/Bobra.0270s0003.1